MGLFPLPNLEQKSLDDVSIPRIFFAVFMFLERWESELLPFFIDGLVASLLMLKSKTLHLVLGEFVFGSRDGRDFRF